MHKWPLTLKCGFSHQNRGSIKGREALDFGFHNYLGSSFDFHKKKSLRGCRVSKEKGLKPNEKILPLHAWSFACLAPLLLSPFSYVSEKKKKNYKCTIFEISVFWLLPPLSVGAGCLWGYSWKYKSSIFVIATTQTLSQKKIPPSAHK